ncbi:MAG: hypothetical protein RIM84_21675 [Alphaproteobacteria bacterium]
MRLRTAFVVWGLLAIASWMVVLVPAYLVFDQGPALMHAWFGDDEVGSDESTAVARPDDEAILTPAQIEALGRIAPAAGGNADDDTMIQPVRNSD